MNRCSIRLVSLLLAALFGVGGIPGVVDADGQADGKEPGGEHRELLFWTDEAGQRHAIEQPEEWGSRRRQILSGMEEAMGALPSRAELPPLAIEEYGRLAGDRYVRLFLSYQAEAGDRVPAYLYLPTVPPPPSGHPAVLALHPTSTLGKGVVAGLSRRPNRAYALELARRGYVVLAPDYVSFGDYPYDFAADGYVSGTMKGIVNHMRGVDLLVERADVDPERVGVIGHSLGGHNAMFVAAFDTRLKAVISSCGWTPFHDYYGGKIAGWTSDRYMPRLRDVYKLDPGRVPFDFYEVVAAIAPRGFFSCSPLGDANFDVRGVRKAEREARKIFALLGAPDRLRVEYPDAGHDFPRRERLASYDWLDQLFGHTPPQEVLVPPAGKASPELRAGMAEVEITPPHAYRMSGYFHERLSTGTHDPLLAKTIYLESGGVPMVFVFCDLVGIAPALSSGVRAAASRRTGIPQGQIVVGATHSHTGPLYFGALRAHFQATALERTVRDPHEVVNYVEYATGRIVDCVERAWGLATPTRLKIAAAAEQELTFQRRFYMEDGTVRFNPGKLNPGIVRPAGPTDSLVQVAALEGAEGRLLGSLTRFALHLDTVGGTEFSADFPHWLELGLRNVHGASFVSVFAPGTCGDLNHIDVSHGERQKGPAEAARIGSRLASRVLSLLEDASFVRPSFAARSRVLELPLQTYTPGELSRALDTMERIGSSEVPFLDRVDAYRVVSLHRRGGTSLALEVQAFRWADDVALVALPGEVFVELGLAIRQESPFATTFVVELCNDAPGYIPTQRGFREGSYEAVNSRLAPGGGEALVEAALGLLREIKGD